jgi:hypothetical protein
LVGSAKDASLDRAVIENAAVLKEGVARTAKTAVAAGAVQAARRTVDHTAKLVATRHKSKAAGNAAELLGGIYHKA